MLGHSIRSECISTSERRTSIHAKLYEDALQLRARKEENIQREQLSRAAHEMSECPFHPRISVHATPGLVSPPRGVSSCVRRLRRARQQREVYQEQLLPRQPIKARTRRVKEAIVEVTRNGSTPGEVIIVGKFRVSADSNPVYLADQFAVQYNLTSDQKDRLCESLCSSIRQL